MCSGMLIEHFFGHFCRSILHDNCVNDFSPIFARNSKYCGLQDPGVLLECGFNFSRLNVHSARDNHVLFSVADVDEPFIIDVGDVADGLKAITVIFHELVVLLVIVTEYRW